MMVNRLYTFFILFTLLIISVPAKSYAQSYYLNNTKTLGIGLQTTYPFSGASVKYKFSKFLSVQGMLGLLFESNQTSFRALYHFNAKDDYTTYMFGQFGQYSVTGFRIDDRFRLKKVEEKLWGYGYGVGVEYNVRSIASSLPVWINIELVYGALKFKKIALKLNALTIGGGVHFYIN
jgi:hypothetical protein